MRPQGQGCIHKCKYRLALRSIHLWNSIKSDRCNWWPNTNLVVIFSGSFSATVRRPERCQDWSLFSSSSLRWCVDGSQRHHPLSRIPRAVRQLFELRLENFCSGGSRHPSEWAQRSVVWCWNTRCWAFNPFYVRRAHILIKVRAPYRFRSWPLPQSTTGTRWIFLMGLMAMLQGLVAIQVSPRARDIPNHEQRP